LGKLRGSLALKCLDTEISEALYTQVAPLQIPVLTIKSKITKQITTQCLYPTIVLGRSLIYAIFKIIFLSK
jgi:hypothetical protein